MMMVPKWRIIPNMFSDHGARAFRYLKEIGVQSTAFSCALGIVQTLDGN